jgi:hypothetical protein
MKTTRSEFTRLIASMVHRGAGYYYVGDYQPPTSTGRFTTPSAAIQSQVDAYDLDPDLAVEIGMRVEAGVGQDRDTGTVEGIERDVATVRWDSLVVTRCPIRLLRRT